MKRQKKHTRSKKGLFGGEFLSIRVEPDAPGYVQYALSTKLGNAVRRNRTRRRLREAIRLLVWSRQGAALIITPRPAAMQATYEQLKTDLALCLSRAGLMSEEVN